MTFNKILVAIDFSDTSTDALDQVLGIAQKTGAELLLLHVLSPSERDYPNNSMFLADGGYLEANLYAATIKSYDDAWQEYRQRHFEQLQALARQVELANIKVDVIERVGQPGIVICETARDWNADLIAIGRRGLTGAKELIFGSVSNYVLHHAPCAVLITHDQPTPQSPSAKTRHSTANPA